MFYTNTLIFDPFTVAAPVEEVAGLNGLDQGPLCFGQWDIKRKLTLSEINWGREIYAYCHLERYGKLSKDASNLRVVKDSDWQICLFKTLKIIQEEGKLCGAYRSMEKNNSFFRF